MSRFLLCVSSFGLGLLIPTAAVFAQYKDDIGFTQLQIDLGVQLPTGAGVSVTQVEAPVSGAYAPNEANAEFSGKTISELSGASGVSSHATDVGSYFYGNTTSIAGGITSIGVYEVTNWVGSGFLNTGFAAAPLVETRDVVNHSWIGSFGSTATDTDIVRRFDFAIHRDNFLAVIGLNNGSGTAVPNLMASSYNGITVGLSNGNHSTGTTSIDGAGRTRPDLVVPLSVTSYATPVVGASGAMLIDKARGVGSLANAENSEVTKAILMAGATKQGEEFQAQWDRTDTRPLDDHYGAGELNIENSYGILVAGEFNSSTVLTAEATGWDFANSGDSSLNWFFEVPIGSVGTEFSAILTWNRLTNGATSTLTNLDLYLYSASGFILGAPIQVSQSAVDNVEHIYTIVGLEAGQYALQVGKQNGADPNVDFGVAWRTEITAVPEPSVAGLLFVGLAFAAARRRSSSKRI